MATESVDITESFEVVDGIDKVEINGKRKTDGLEENENNNKSPPINLARPNGVPADPTTWGRPGHLTAEEVTVYEKFRDEVEKRGGDYRDTVYSFGEEEGEPNALCRWLRARKYKLDLVIQMVEEATETRSEPKKANFYPDPQSALGVEPHVYLAQYPQLYYGNGKNGCPVFISKPGKLNINAMECVTAFKRVINFHWYAMMHDFKNKLQENKVKNKDFNNFACIIILDLAGLSVSQLNSRTLSIIKEQTFIDSLCFPETMSRTFVINAPRFFSATWVIIRGWLDARTVSKMEVLSSRKTWEKRLLEYIDVDQLPSDYGGTGTHSDVTIVQDNSTGDIKRSHTEVLSIRSSSSTVIALEKGEKMDITIYCKAKGGSIFSVTDANNKKGPFAQNVDVTFSGGNNLDDEPPLTVKICSNLIGPGKFKVKGVSKKTRVTSCNFLIACNIYDN